MIKPAPVTTLSATFSSLALLALSTAPVGAAPENTLNNRCWDITFFEPFDELNLVDAENSEGWTTQYIWDRSTIINNELQYYVDPHEHPVNPFLSLIHI